MRHVKQFDSFDFELIRGTYFFIEGNNSKVKKILKKLKKSLDINDVIDLDNMIHRIDKDALHSKSIGFFIYYSSYGFSFSIIKDVDEMINKYNSIKESKIYEYIGELEIINDKIIFNNNNFLKNLDKYNL